MSSTSANAAHHGGRERSLAQLFCYVIGGTLVAVGLLGFLADATFDTGDAINGSKLIVFEVNGWHNLVHIASGLFLLAMARRHDTARTGAIAFGVIYGIVTAIGLIDGSDVLGIFPVNPADNVLHIALTALALYTGLVSRPDNDAGARRQEGVETVGTTGSRTGSGTRAGR